MIHVATVHWQDDRWIDVQLRYFEAYMGESYRVYTFLNGIDADPHRDKFFYCSIEPIEKHAIKLNLLADIIGYAAASDEDLILFLDGDAFPISNVSAYAREKLADYPLLAVQRRENDGDIQPHPCFCVTTVGFWKSIWGDWKAGYEWRNGAGRTVTDVGGNLLKILQERGMEWYPMLRSNKVDLHPLWFGIYDNVAYHHGAAFRPMPVSRFEHKRRAEHMNSTQRFIKLLPRRGPLRKLHRQVDQELVTKISSQNKDLGKEIFQDIQVSREFFAKWLY